MILTAQDSLPVASRQVFQYYGSGRELTPPETPKALLGPDRAWFPD
jgi:hypothetical protein